MSKAPIEFGITLVEELGGMRYVVHDTINEARAYAAQRYPDCVGVFHVIEKSHYDELQRTLEMVRGSRDIIAGATVGLEDDIRRLKAELKIAIEAMRKAITMEPECNSTAMVLDAALKKITQAENE